MSDPTRPRPELDRDVGDDDEREFFGFGPTGQEFENPVASGAAFLGVGSGRQADFGDELLPGGTASVINDEDVDDARGIGIFGEPL